METILFISLYPVYRVLRKAPTPRHFNLYFLGFTVLSGVGVPAVIFRGVLWAISRIFTSAAAVLAYKLDDRLTV